MLVKGGILFLLVLLLVRGRPLSFPDGAGDPAPQVETEEKRAPEGWEGVALFPEGD